MFQNQKKIHEMSMAGDFTVSAFCIHVFYQLTFKCKYVVQNCIRPHLTIVSILHGPSFTF